MQNVTKRYKGASKAASKKAISKAKRTKLLRLTAELVEQALSEEVIKLSEKHVKRADKKGGVKHWRRANALTDLVSTARKIVKMAAAHE